MNISLPENMRDFVETEVRTGGFSTASEYFRSLIRAAARKKDEEHLEALMMEGINSGPPEPWTKEDIKRIREEGRKIIEQRRQINRRSNGTHHHP